jgi:hypothetical protein
VLRNTVVNYLQNNSKEETILIKSKRNERRTRNSAIQLADRVVRSEDY